MSRVPVSTLARYGLVVLTAGVGVAALRKPGPYGVGVVTMLAAVWLLAGATRAFVKAEPARLSWAVFCVAAAASLALSFGPWSDSGARQAWPEPATWETRAEALQPVTRLLVRLMPVVRPEAVASIGWEGPRGSVSAQVRVRGAFDRVEGVDEVRNEVARLAYRLSAGEGDGSARLDRAYEIMNTSLTMGDYQAIGHMLAALALGGLAFVSTEVAGGARPRVAVA
jgi:hypothetical protein